MIRNLAGMLPMGLRVSNFSKLSSFSNIFIGKVDPAAWLSTANETFKARSEQSQSDPEILRTGLKPVPKEDLCSVCTTKYLTLLLITMKFGFVQFNKLLECVINWKL